MTEFEKLVLEFETKGLDAANTAIAKLDRIADAAEKQISGLEKQSTATSRAFVDMGNKAKALTAELSSQSALMKSHVSATSANTAAMTKLLTAVQGLATTVATNALATKANTASVRDNTVVTSSNSVATATNTGTRTAHTASMAANTAMLSAAAAATAANSSMSAANTAALGTQTAATSAASVASGRVTAALTTATGAFARGAVGARTYAGAVGLSIAPMTAATAAAWRMAAPLAAILTPLVAVQQLIKGTRTFEDFSEQLRTVTGSTEKATTAYEALMDFAVQTPYSLDQGVEGFVKLVSFGLNPSERAMRSLGNIASAMGKELNQMIQAVAMASVHNFVRLKQFGILAHKEGNQIAFDFQGVRTMVNADAKSIQEHLIKLGETEFAGAMERRMKTLTGAMSNFGDEWLKFTQNISQLGPDNGLTRLFLSGTEALAELNAQLASGEFEANMQAYEILWSGLFTRYREAFEELPESVNTVLGMLPEGLSEALQTMVTDTEAFVQYFPENLNLAMVVTEQYIGAFISKTSNSWSGLTTTFGVAMDGVVDVASTATSSVGDTLEALVTVGSTSATLIVEAFQVEFNRLISIANATGAAVGIALQGQVAGALKVLEGGTKIANAIAAQKQGDIQTKALEAGKALEDLEAKASSVQTNIANAYTTAAKKIEDTLINTNTNSAIDAERDKNIAAAVAESDAVVAAYEAKKAAAVGMRAEYEKEVAARRAGQGDRLEEFWKKGDGSAAPKAATNARGGRGGGGSAADREAREGDRYQQQMLESRLRLLEEGLEGENMVLSASYEQQRVDILKNTATTAEQKKALVMQAMSEGLVTEEDALRDSYDRRREFVLSAEALTAEQKNALLIRLEKNREQELMQFQIASQRDRLNAASTFFGDLASMGSTFGKRGFKIAKAAAIAQATIKTYESATSAYASLAGIPYVGPVLGAAAAAAAIAAGAANIATIKSQEYAGAYEHGGMIPSGKFGLVGEAGPELVRGPAVVTSAATTASRSGGGGIRSVTVNNNGAPVAASAQVNGDELILMLQPHLDATRARVKSELADEITRGGGKVSGSLERSYGVNRSRNTA
jgi:hypothetical protein